MNRRYFIFNLFTLLLLLGVNLFFFIKRDDGYAYKEVLSYKQLYELEENIRITGLNKREGDSLLITFSHPARGREWRVSGDGSHPAYTSAYPLIKLNPGKHSYTLKDLSDKNSQEIKVGLNYTLAKDYIKNGRQSESVIEFFFASVPVGNYKLYTLKDWQQGFNGGTSEDTKLTKALISGKIPIQKADSTVQKIKKTGAFLLQQLNPYRGIPGDIMNGSSGWLRYRLALDGKSKVWCGDFSTILSFFLSVQGISCREVCLEGKLNTISLSGHSFNEAYIPELKQWVIVDLTAGALLFSFHGSYLNAIELFNLHKSGAEKLKAVILRHDSIISQDYEEIKSFYSYYFANGPEFVYYFNNYYDKSFYSAASKTKRYFFKVPAFASYAGITETDQSGFYYKQAAFLVLFSFLIFLIINYYAYRTSKKNPRA